MNRSQIFTAVMLGMVTFMIPPAFLVVRDVLHEPTLYSPVIEYPPTTPQPRPLDEWVAPEKGFLPVTPISRMLSR